MARFVTAVGVVTVVLAFWGVAVAEAKPLPPPPPGLNASLTLTTSVAPCTGTLAVSWNGGNGKTSGITGLTWAADPLSTGAMTFTPPAGATFSKAQKIVTQTIAVTLSAGTGKVDVSASGPGVSAQNTSNTVTCVAPQPDLVVSAITQDPNSWAYTATVKNIGVASADLTGVAVQGYYTSSTDVTQFPPVGGLSPQIAGGDPAGGSVVPGSTLMPGATVDVVLGSTGPTVAGDTQLMVGVDVDHVLAESNEGNNVAVMARVTPPLPDLAITDISQDPNDWNFSVTIANGGPGTAPASNLTVIAYYTASTNTSVFPPASPSETACIASIPFGTTLAPNDAVTVHFQNCSGPLNSANNELMVGVNVTGPLRILENGLTNNVVVAALQPPGTNSVSCSISQGTTFTWKGGTTQIAYTFYEADQTTVTDMGNFFPPNSNPGSIVVQQQSRAAYVQATFVTGGLQGQGPKIPCGP